MSFAVKWQGSVMGKSLILGAVFLALAGLAACQTEAPPAPAAGLLSDAERADCLAHGGRVGRGGIVPDEVCFRPTPDAGASCQKAGDCTGMCMAETKTCAKVTPQFGCMEILDETGRSVGLCVD